MKFSSPLRRLVGKVAIAGGAFFVSAGIASAAGSGPVSIGYYCPPATASYEEGGFYQAEGAGCTYLSENLLGVRFGDTYIGTVGSSTLLTGHSLAQNPIFVQNDEGVVALAPGTHVFVAIYHLRSGPIGQFDLDLFRNFFQNGSVSAPHSNYGVINWTVGAPPPVGCTENCFSSVLFLPGLQASRLYESDGGQLWTPPIFGAQNLKLALNPDGSSVESDIYTNDVIDEALGFNVYKSFIERMDSLVSGGTIADWKPFAYDWRFDVNDVVNTPTALPNGQTISLPEEVDRLAAESKSGKVTIIAHSNGGLLGKALIAKLEELGKEDLIDKFIMVAVPQLGTPKAIATLLHGEGMPFDWFPFLLTARESRTVAENMASGYSLLPSAEYFNRVLDPVIEFESTTETLQPYVNTYGVAVTNPAELKNFLLGADGRAKPTASDLLTPNILNSSLLTKAEQNHASFDTWQAPAGIEVIQVAGWGIDTVRGIRYFEKEIFDNTFCSTGCTVLDHEPLFTIDGDQTVVVPSAAALNGEAYYFNLPESNLRESLFNQKKHFNILESGFLLNFLAQIIQDEAGLPELITQELPNSGDIPSSLRIKVHSPVSIDLYDSQGKHTGIASSTTFGISLIEEDIPNSYYLAFGEGKYVGTSLTGATHVQLDGTGSGTFTLEVEKLQGGIIEEAATFTDILVRPNTLASLTIESPASPLPELRLDIDGDGNIDATIESGEGISIDEFLEILRGTIKDLGLLKKKEDRLLKIVDRLEKVVKKEFRKEAQKKQRLKQVIKNLLQHIKNFEKKNLLTPEEALELRNIIESIQKLVLN